MGRLGKFIDSMTFKESSFDGNRGFSLAESMVAILLLSVVLTAGISFFTNANQRYYYDIKHRLAVFLADEKMEEIKYLGYQTVVPDEDGESVSLGVLTQATRYVLKPSACADDRCVTVRVDWNDEASAISRSVVLQTFIGL